MVSIILAALCLVLGLAVISTGKTSQKLQTELQQQQSEINNGLLSQRGQQLGNSILQDMVSVSARNPRMYKLLGENGYNITFQQPAASATIPAKNNKVTP
ncbi:MAG: hypothetical protein EPN23_00615 [Verrucomicrobia bacterium]|nr:MAG: hypothetical protein EPN23_00615 [Verrucomicrobiota bacterium]